MSRLNYLGPFPLAAEDTVSRQQAAALIADAPVNRTDTSVSVESAAGSYAGKSYIDTADAAFAPVSDYLTKDALNLPLEALGTPNGVATLDATGKIPAAQIPTLGAGYVKGPFGPTAVGSVPEATTTLVKIADFALGSQGVAFHPLCYASVLVDTKPGGRPILEMRMSNGPVADPASQVLVAAGMGQSTFAGVQVVAVTPGIDTLNAANPAPYPVGYNTLISLYIRSSSTTPVAVSSSGLLSAAVFLVRTVQ